VITSQQLSIKVHSLENLKMVKHEVLSWTRDEYEAAVKVDAIKQQVKAVVAPSDQVSWEDQFQAKYFLAGGSCRFMFHLSSQVVMQAIDTALTDCSDIKLLSGMRGDASALATNTLIQLTEKGRFLISEYVVRKLSARVDAEFVKLARQVCRNPSLDGWILEMDFLIRIKHPSGMTLYALSNEPRVWEFLGQTDFHDPSDISEIKTGWLVPDRWNQGGYDAVRVTILTKDAKAKKRKTKTEAKEEKVIVEFVQVTRASDHSFTSGFMNAMVSAIAAKTMLPIEKKFFFLVPRGRGVSFKYPTVDSAWLAHVSLLEFQRTE